MAARLRTTPNFVVTAREFVMDDPYIRGSNHQQYDVAPDGRTFVFSKSTGSTAKVIYVANWAAEVTARLKKRQ